MTQQNGKGSSRRPRQTSHEKFSSNWDEVFKKKELIQQDRPPCCNGGFGCCCSACGPCEECKDLR